MSTDLDRQEWIRRARTGDREAFDRLARENEGPLRTLIAIQLGDGMRGRVEVDDLLQETLLRAFRSMGQFEGETESALRSWLVGIAQHAVIDGARRLTSRKADYRREVSLTSESPSGAGGSDAPSREISSPATSPSRILRREERLDRLLDSIEGLSPDHRQVIFLARIERLPVKVVAQRMGRSEKAVSMLLLRAMLALREVFGETESLTLPRESREGGAADRAPGGDPEQ